MALLTEKATNITRLCAALVAFIIIGNSNNYRAKGFIAHTSTHTPPRSSSWLVTGSSKPTVNYQLIDVSLAVQQAKKRRRKRSDDDSSNRSVDSIPNESLGSVTEIDISITDGSLVEESSKENEEEDLMEAFDEVEDNSVVKDDKKPVFKFDRNEAIAFGIEDASDGEDIPEQFQLAPKNKIGGAIDLPSMKESVTRKKARSTSSTEQQQSEGDSAPEKIKRSNIQIFNKLLEVEPNADTDLSLFEDEKYGTVSALLGEGAKSFLGLPLAILQTGHFFGTLAFLLMAFVEYPGFPLTNLPTPIREALQGGLFTIYTTNAVLAIFAVFKAEERGQPKSLWAIKTFGVGGLAYDQLTQLPTKDQMSKLNKKGKKQKRGRT